jgi:hypothetical protein
MVTTIQRHQVHRRADLDGKTLYFMIYSGSRNRPHKFFRPGVPPLIPPFEGASAWFEVERNHRGEWKFLRQVADRTG